MNQLAHIRKLSEDYDKESVKVRENRLQRMLVLIDTHGVSNVAAAAGLKESSVVQLSRTKGETHNISERRLAKAESILASL